MKDFLVGLGNMSLQAGFVILVVLAVGLLLAKLQVAKKYVYILWMVAFLCIICLWKLETSFGFGPQTAVYKLPVIHQLPEERKEEQAIADDLGGREETDENETGEAAQLGVIAQNIDSWVGTPEYAEDVYCYAVTDLDKNGRLELIVASMGGTGIYTYSKFYEMNEALNALEECKTDFIEGDSQPDIIEDKIIAYEEAGGKVHYIFQDDMKVDATLYIDCLVEVTFENGSLCHKQLARRETSILLDTPKITCFNAVGEEITEDAYEQAAAKAFADALMMQVTFGWRNVRDMEDFSQEDLLSTLEASYNEFGYRKAEATENQVLSALPSLTMEELIALCKEGTVGEAMQNLVWQDGMIYENFSRRWLDYSLTWSYTCNLDYGDRTYAFYASYWKAETANSYAHPENQLDSVYLVESITGDMILLYSQDVRYTVNLNIEEFLKKEYSLEQYMSFKLPEAAWLGQYTMDMNDIFQGCLIQGDYEEVPHGENLIKAWYAPGFIGLTEMYHENAVFEDEKLTEYHWLMNHSLGEKVEELEDCDMSAVLYTYSFDLFTLPELETYAAENHISTEDVKSMSNFWIVFFGEPDSEFVYMVGLNQEYFTKEDVIALADSVRFVR